MNALVIGGARSGLAVAKLLNAKGYDVTLTTNQDFPQRDAIERLGIRVSLNDRDLNLVKPYDVVVKNPGISNNHPLVCKFESVVNEIEVATWFAPHYTYYAVSGTNGKTTTVSLLHEMLVSKNDNALLAGNVGYALSEAVFQDGDAARDVALEISAFQMEGTPSFAPDVYGILNLSPDHLDRYDGNAEAYYAEKVRILPNVKCFVKNMDDANIVRLTQNYRGETITLSLKNQNTDIYRDGTHIMYRDVRLFDLRSLKIVGEHNIYNAAMAAYMAYRAHVPVETIQNVVASFTGVEHRIEYVATVHGVRYYNDSKATNPESTEVALKAFDKNIILLAGGFDKRISFEGLRPYANRIKAIYVFGESAEQIKSVFPNAVVVKTMLDGTKNAINIAVSGDVVLLSPACASYDQFDNYEQRGTIFKEYIKTLE